MAVQGYRPGISVALAMVATVIGLDAARRGRRTGADRSPYPPHPRCIRRSTRRFRTTCCAARTTSPVTVDVSSPSGTLVDVDGQGPRGGTFTAKVLLQAGQSFGITATSGATSASYNVRCLPSDVPRWTFRRFGQSQSEWFTAAPLAKTNFGPPPPGVSVNYMFIFDGNGVPVWWRKATQQQTDFLVFPNGNPASLRGGDAGGEERRLDGSLIRTIRPAGCGHRSARVPAPGKRELPDHHIQDDPRPELLRPLERADPRQRRSGGRPPAARSCGHGGRWNTSR